MGVYLIFVCIWVFYQLFSYGLLAFCGILGY